MSLLDLIKNIRLYLAEKINAYNFVNWGAITNLVPEGLAALLVVDWGFARLQEYLELESPYNEALYVARIGLDGAAFYSVFEVFRRVFIVLTLPTAHNLLEADWWRTTFNFREWHPRDYITFVSKLVSTFNISLIWTGIRRIIFQSISGTLRDRFNNPFTDGLARLIENPLFETPFMISAFALNAMIYPATIDT
ncbi:MAG: hypothetical protein JSS53_02600, partial [Proteobacteria bacterium]|nr:hypothetical protein [Pseudomonadota bacterium]